MVLSAVFHFADFVLDVRRRQLRRGGALVPLQPRVFSLLAYLVAERDRAVSKRELFDAVWPGETVTGSSLTQAVRAARRALSDDGTTQRWIETARGHGYRFAGEVTLGPESRAGGGDRGLVGRAAELTQLHTLWAAGLDRAPSLALLRGPAGMGKTRLLEAFVAELPPDRVAIARVSQSGGAPAYWPWLQLLEQLGRDADDLVGGTGSRSSSSAQFRAFARITQALAEAADGAPLCLGLEDLHWWDGSSLSLLQHVLEQARAPLRMVATTRNAEGRDGRVRSARVSTLELRGLDVASVARLVRQAIPDAAEPRVERWAPVLRERTGGNPYFIHELLHHGLERRDGLPAGVESLLDDHIAGRSEPEQRLLEALCAFGRPVGVLGLAQVVGRPASAIEVDLVQLSQVGLVRQAEGEVALVHALLHERVAHRMAAPTRRALHRRILTRLERDLSLDPNEAAPRRLHHARLAAESERSEAVFTAALQAAAQAERQHAHLDAASHLGVALASHPEGGLVSSDAVSLLLRRARAQTWAGERPAAEVTLRRAWTLAEREAQERLAEVALGRGMVNVTGQVSTTEREDVVWMRRALETVPKDAWALRLELTSQLAIATFWMGDRAGAEALLDAARSMPAAPDTRAGVLRDFAEIVLSQLAPEPREGLPAIADVALRARERCGPDIELAARVVQVNEALRLGRAGQVDEVVDVCEGLLESERHPLRGMLTTALAHARAPLAELLDTVAAFERQLARTHNPNRVGLSFVHRFFSERERDGLAGLQDAIAAGRQAHPATIFWQVASIVIAIEQGASARAHALIDTLFEDHDPDAPVLLATPCWTLLAMAAAPALRPAQAERLHDGLLPYARHHALIGFPGVYLGPTATGLARLEVQLGMPERAVARAREGLRATVALGACRPRIESLLTLSEALGANGRDSEARLRARDALECANEGGFTRLSRWARMIIQ